MCKFIYIIIHSGWSLACIFMKERVNAILTLGASGARVSNGDPGSGFIANVYFCFVSPEMIQ